MFLDHIDEMVSWIDSLFNSLFSDLVITSHE